MFVVNSSKLNNTFSCNTILGKYLESHQIPIVGIEDGTYYFADTDDLQEVLIKLPFYLKPFAKQEVE